MRTLMLVICLILPTIVLAVQEISAQSQSGLTVDERAAGQINACRAMGGIEEVYSERTPGGGLTFTSVLCKGGLLDGLWCGNAPSGTYCSFGFVRPDQPPNVRPTGGIEVEPQEPLETLVITESSSELPVVAEDSTVTDNAVRQVNSCRTLSGAEVVISRDTVDGPWIVVLCVGGLGNGLWCYNDHLETSCDMPPRVRADDGSHMTPVSGIEVGPETPTETAAPTVTPTATVTGEPLLPTVVSTDPPVVPTIPTGDNAVPPGESEDPSQPEPTPTEAPFG
jgi:hypothetical protein